MAERRIKKTRKDSDGDIIRVCNSDEYWIYEERAVAIDHIESGTHSYYVDEAGSKAHVEVITVGLTKYLRTQADAEPANNLDNLPDC